MNRKLVVIFLSVLLFSAVAYAAAPQIESMTVNPPAPDFGERITVTVIYCGDRATSHKIGIVASIYSNPDDARIPGSGQIFIVSAAGVNKHTSVPAAILGGEIGYTASAVPGNGAPVNCMTCGSSSNDGTRITVVYGDDEYLTMPKRENFPSNCSNAGLNMHAVMKDTSMLDAAFHTQASCQKKSISWNVPVPPQALSILKRMEGVLQSANDLLLVSVDYTYSNGAAVIKDKIPAIAGTTFNMISHSTQGAYSGPANGAVSAGQGLTWNLPSRAGSKGAASGTIWYLLKINGTPTAGAVISETANASMASLSDMMTASITVNKPSFMVKTTAHTNGAYQGDTMTYYIDYSMQGYQLAAFQSFDDLLGTYTSSPPSWWQFVPSASNGTWYVENSCVAGDRIIRGDTTSDDDYPSLLYSGYSMTSDATCLGVMVVDALINPLGYDGADNSIIIRHNGLSGMSSKMYGFSLSLDNYIGTSTGYMAFVKNNGGTVTWPGAVSSMRIDGNKWYRIKIRTGPTNACQFSARVWLRGDPEPDTWATTWTDTNCIAQNMDCAASATTWYAGIGEQGDTYAFTQDSYDNFMLFRNRIASNAVVYDSIPAGITFIGQQGPAAMSIGPSPVLGWNISSAMAGNGVFTWWGRVDACGSGITNTAAIDGDDPVVPNLSNRAIIGVTCPPTATPTFTITRTHTVSPTFDGVSSPTITPTATKTSTPYASSGNVNLYVASTGSTDMCVGGNYYNFTLRIYNYGPNPAVLQALRVKFWFYGTSTITVNNFSVYKANPYVALSSPSNSTVQVYPCLITGQMASKYIMLDFGDQTLASGQNLDWVGAFVAGTTYLDPDCNDYSVLPPSSAGNFKNITMYSNGQLIYEALDSFGNLDPDTGSEPCGGLLFSPTITNTNTAPPTITPTWTLSKTPTVTDTVTMTGTETRTATYTYSDTITPTFTCTPSVTVSPTITPTYEVQIFKNCDALLDGNGTWSGTNAVRTLSTNSSAVTQGTGCVRAYINTEAAFNNEVLICSGFSPDVWSDVERLTADIYVDPASVPWTFFSSRHNIVLYANGYQLSQSVEINPNMNHVEFYIDYGLAAGNVLPADALTSFSLNLDLDGTSTKTGAIYVDNMQLWYRAPTFTATLTAVVSPTPTRTPDMGLAEAVDNFSLLWETGGVSLWTLQTLITQDSVDAAQSGAVSDWQKSILQTSAGGTGHLSFYWKVDSRAGDSLKFKIDGIEQSSISGNINWRLEEFDLDMGLHLLSWEYEKDNDGLSSGADKGWVDLVGYYMTTPTTTLTRTVTKTHTVTPTATVTNTPQPGATQTATRAPANAGPGESFVYPQPALKSVTFAYSLSSPAEVKIYIYNFSGRLAGEMQDTYTSGTNRKVFDCSVIPSGVYYYVIEEKRNGKKTMQKPKSFMVAR